MTSAGPGPQKQREASDRVTVGILVQQAWNRVPRLSPSGSQSSARADVVWRGLSLISEEHLSGDSVCQALGRCFNTHDLHGRSAARGL